MTSPPPASRRRAKASPFTYAEMARDTALVPAPGGGPPLEIAVAVDHHMRAFEDPVPPLAMGEWLAMDEPILHHFELIAAGTEDEAGVPGVRRRASALAPFRRPDLPWDFHTRAWRDHRTWVPRPTRRPVFARLVVGEYPDEWVRLSGEGWGEAMEHRDDAVRPLVEWIARESLEGELVGGSCLVFRQLHGHPALRGQAIGARLVAHALLFLARSMHDVAVLEALPIPSIWDAPGPDGTRAVPPRTRVAVERLVRHYERLGFHRGPRSTQRPTERDGGIVMWYSYVTPLPFHPLEGTGRRDRRATWSVDRAGPGPPHPESPHGRQGGVRACV